MTPTPSGTRRLERTKVLYLRKGQAPYRPIRDDDGKVVGQATTAEPLYVRRGKGLSPHIRTTGGKSYTWSMTNDELALARRVAAKYNWTLIERRADILLKPVDRWPHLDGDLDCNQQLLDKLDLVARDLGETILVRSGERTMDEQWALYNQLGPSIAAYPSATAPHVRGIAADCGINGVNIGAVKGAREAMLKHGLCLRVANENWHVEVGSRSRWAANWLP